LDRKLGGPQSRFGRGGEEKNSHPPLGIGDLRVLNLVRNNNVNMPSIAPHITLKL